MNKKDKFKQFIKNHPDNNFKKYILEKAKKDPKIYERINNESEKLVIVAEIIALRKRKKLTQAQLAKKIGTSQSAIAKIESGQRSPTTDTLVNIARATNTKFLPRFI